MKRSASEPGLRLLLWLNNLKLVSLVFSKILGPEQLDVCTNVVFFKVFEYHDFLICFEARNISVHEQNTQQCICSDRKTLESQKLVGRLSQSLFPVSGGQVLVSQETDFSHLQCTIIDWPVFWQAIGFEVKTGKEA